MPRRLSLVCSVSCAFALPILIVGCGAPSNTGKIDPGVTAADGKTATDFTIPDGSPAKILESIKELRSRRPNITNKDERIAYIKNVQNAMIQASDKILAQKTDDKFLREAMTAKLFATLGMAAIYEHDSPEFDEAAQTALQVVNVYRQDKRAGVAKVANGFWIAARALNLKTYSDGDRKKLGDEAIKSVVDSQLSQEAIGDVVFLAGQYAKNGDHEEAALLYDRVGKILAESSNKKAHSYAAQFRLMAERARLEGNPLRLEGPLLSGGELDWESYRGKVVLVDFWATWCKPCVLVELPNVKAAYEKYHSKGFDVIAISLDHNRDQLESFVKKESLPWAQLFDNEVQVVKKQPSPMAARYSVSSIPTAFLVDKEGNVVSLEVRGDELNRLLEKLLGTVE